jgi:hypothetical protein
MHKGGASGPISRTTSLARICGANSVAWPNHERIQSPVTISRRRSQGGINGCLRITKIQGMTADSFLSEKSLRPRLVDGSTSEVQSALLAACSKPALALALIETLRCDR